MPIASQPATNVGDKYRRTGESLGRGVNIYGAVPKLPTVAGQWVTSNFATCRGREGGSGCQRVESTCILLVSDKAVLQLAVDAIIEQDV